MATQYTPILKLALPREGELDGSWGDVVNDNITSMLEEAIAGAKTINTWSSNSHTLTVADGTTSESRASMLNLTDTNTQLTGTATLICPNNTKAFYVYNNTGQIVSVKTSAGTGVNVDSGRRQLLLCDGTNVVTAITDDAPDIDYEEGSWTPTFLYVGGVTVNVANYVKVGKMVTLFLNISSFTQNIETLPTMGIGGLPFAPKLTSGHGAGGGVLSPQAQVQYNNSSVRFGIHGSELRAWYDNNYGENDGTGNGGPYSGHITYEASA